MSTPDVLDRRTLEKGLGGATIGNELHLLQDVGSTNVYALELARKGAREGCIVAAETQTHGKGRLGRTWVSPRGNLYFSVVLRPKVPPAKAPLITLVGAIAVASAIRKQLEVPAGIKWPNDIMVSDRKLGGVLTEMSAEPDRIGHIVLGIGVNVNMRLTELPPDVRRTATTLAAEAGRQVDRSSLLAAILRELERWYAFLARDEAAILGEWEALNITLGKRVAVVQGVGQVAEGTAEGIDHEGRLLLRRDDGTVQTVAAGDVTVLEGPGAPSGRSG